MSPIEESMSVMVNYIVLAAGVIIEIWGWPLLFRKVPSGSCCGLRTIQTLRDFGVWQDVNELLGLCLSISGLVLIVMSMAFWALPENTLWLLLRAGFFVVALAVEFVTSTVLLRNRLYSAVEEAESTDQALLEML
ncbi:MAG: hypothetical protein Q8P67_03750 [archaeon]|nr:hypothetical protein [archaeon]